MHPLSIPVLIMASISFYVSLYHLIFFIKRRKILDYLYFSLVCLAVGLYDVFTVGLYNSTSIDQGIYWQQKQVYIVIFISISIILFISYFTSQYKNKIIRILTIWFVLLSIIGFFIDEKYTLSASRPLIKTINLTEKISITYYEAELGILFIIEIISALITFLYLLFLLFRHYLRKKNTKTLVIITGQLSYFIGVLNDTLVSSGYINFIYLSEYSFLIIILSMAYVLLSDFVNLHSTVEQYSENLEIIVNERTEEIKKLNEELRHLSEIDPLTGIYNRRFFDEYFDLEIKRARNEIEYLSQGDGRPYDMNFGLAIIDVDNFKKINDTYGHPRGDRVLVETVELVKKHIFTRDIFCRYGGEEFVLLLTRTTREGIIKALEKIRCEIEKHSYDLGQDTPEGHITASIGAVMFDEVSNFDNTKIIEIADNRLLTAKSSGKNMTVFE